MESIGMSKKQINQLLIREGVLYALFSVFITLTIGSVITYICFESIINTGQNIFKPVFASIYFHNLLLLSDSKICQGHL